jgi:hypothetical protein
MRKTFNKLALGFLATLAVLLFPALAEAQQNYLIQTTLTTALPAPAAQNIAAPVPYAAVTVGSATGISGILGNQTGTINQQNSWQIYIDRELMQVVSVNGLVLQVQRGIGGTVATSHAAGAMVLAGRPQWFNVSDPATAQGLGGAPSSQGLTMPTNAPCVLANVVASPWVNIRTGAQWICSTTSLTWVAGFGNPFLPFSSSSATTASVAGATNIAFPMTKISGTNAITSWTFTGNGAIGVAGNATVNGATSSFCVIPTGAYTTVVGNNIGVATTGKVGAVQCWYWDGPDGKWYSSY